MEIRDALKALAPAVGDGKLVWQHAYVLAQEDALRVCDGSMWASATIDPRPQFFVRYDRLADAIERPGAELLVDGQGPGMIVRAGRSRLKLKGADPTTFPPEPDGMPRWIEAPPVGFKDTLRDLSAFCGKQDNHIWQMGVHFLSDVAFVSNPFALVICAGQQFPQGPISIPPWATRFIVAQDDAPNVVADADRYIKFIWDHRLSLTSTVLIESAPDNIIDYARRLIDEPTQGVPVPENLKDSVRRVKSMGATSVRIGNGKIDHMTEELEFEEEVDIASAPRIWGVETMLAALEHATTINLSGDNAKWEGNGYKGIFAGRSG